MLEEDVTLESLSRNYSKLVIPDIQRDYVMGSGGAKLRALLGNMKSAIARETTFHFSCLIGYKKEVEDSKAELHIYDGQQRLVTLLCLCAYLESKLGVSREKPELEIKGKALATDWLKDASKINDDDVVDFTTYSMVRLLEEFCQARVQQNGLQRVLDFFCENVKFTLILVSEQSDAEQFFLDINDGLDLTEAELYKAALYHNIKLKTEPTAFKQFALKLENNWLNFFTTVGGEGIDVETKLALFLQYCLRMMWIESHGSAEEYDIYNFEWLDAEHIKRLEAILDMTVAASGNSSKITWISEDTHWNLADDQYPNMVRVFLEHLSETAQTCNDILVWCYLSQRSQQKDTQAISAYLRMLKKILNNDRGENKKAILDRSGNSISDRQIHYPRYLVRGIPRYYIQAPVFWDFQAPWKLCPNAFMDKLILVNKNANVLDLEAYLQGLCDLGDEALKAVAEKEIKKRHAFSQNPEELTDLENKPFINGLLDNFLEYSDDSCEWISNRNQWDFTGVPEEPSYAWILQFIQDKGLDLKPLLTKDCTICYTNYCGTSCGLSGNLLPHTLCDLFTMKWEARPSNEQLAYQLGTLPDGWFNEEWDLIQPAETITPGKRGFESYTITAHIGNLRNAHVGLLRHNPGR